MLTRYLVIDANRPARRLIVYGNNGAQAGVEGAKALHARSVHVYTTHEDGSTNKFVARVIQ